MAVRLFRASPCGSVRAPQGGVRSVQFRASPCVPSRGVSGVVLGMQKGLTELCVIDVGGHYRGRVVILRIDVGIGVPTWCSLSLFLFAATSVSMFICFAATYVSMFCQCCLVMFWVLSHVRRLVV